MSLQPENNRSVIFQIVFFHVAGDVPAAPICANTKNVWSLESKRNKPTKQTKRQKPTFSSGVCSACLKKAKRFERRHTTPKLKKKKKSRARLSRDALDADSSLKTTQREGLLSAAAWITIFQDGRICFWNFSGWEKKKKPELRVEVIYNRKRYWASENMESQNELMQLWWRGRGSETLFCKCVSVLNPRVWATLVWGVMCARTHTHTHTHTQDSIIPEGQSCADQMSCSLFISCVCLAGCGFSFVTVISFIYLFCFTAPIGVTNADSDLLETSVRALLLREMLARAGGKKALLVCLKSWFEGIFYLFQKQGAIFLFFYFFGSFHLISWRQPSQFFKQVLLPIPHLSELFSNNLSRFFRFRCNRIIFFLFCFLQRTRWSNVLLYFIVWFLCVTQAPLFHVLWLSILYDSLYSLRWKRMQRWIFITLLLFWVHFIRGKMFQIFCFLA